MGDPARFFGRDTYRTSFFVFSLGFVLTIAGLSIFNQEFLVFIGIMIESAGLAHYIYVYRKRLLKKMNQENQPDKKTP